MLRIAIAVDASSRVALQLEGALIGAWVDELARVCAPALASGGQVTLDLAAVSFVGREGVALLTSLRERRVALLNCSALVAEQLKAYADSNGSPA